MRSALIADVIIYTRRPELAKIASEHLKMKGVSNLLMPAKAGEACDALDRFTKALLILDWEVGGQDAVQVLSHNRKRHGGQMRPILLIAPQVSEVVIATAAEYSVAQIFTEQLTLKNLGARLANLLIGESLPDEIKSALADVYIKREGGDLRSATRILLKLLAKHPTNLRVKCEAAEMLLRTGEPDKALQVLEGMDKTKPPYLRGIHMLGRCLMKVGQFKEALKVLEQATLYNPHDVDRLVDIGQAFLHEDRLSDARAQFDKALSIDSTHRGAKRGKGQVKLMDGQVNEALQILKDVAGEVEMASLFNTCAVMNMRRGRHDSGMALYQSALGALGKDAAIQARLFFNMGLGYRRWGKKKEAMQAFQQAIKLDMDFAKAKEQIAILKAGGAGPSAVPAAKRPAPVSDSTADALLSADIFGTDDLSALTGMFEEDIDEESLFPVGRKPA